MGYWRWTAASCVCIFEIYDFGTMTVRYWRLETDGEGDVILVKFRCEIMTALEGSYSVILYSEKLLLYYLPI